MEEKDIIAKTESATLPPPAAIDEAARVNRKPFAVRYATTAEFEKAHRKTKTLHAGLFRRLAK